MIETVAAVAKTRFIRQVNANCSSGCWRGSRRRFLGIGRKVKSSFRIDFDAELILVSGELK